MTKKKKDEIVLGSFKVTKKLVEMAKAKGINISETCRKALEKAVGPEYQVELLKERKANLQKELNNVDNDLKELESNKPQTTDGLHLAVTHLIENGKIRGSISEDEIMVQAEIYNLDSETLIEAVKVLADENNLRVIY